MEWNLDTSTVGGVQRIAPTGELDLVTAPLLARELQQAERVDAAPIVLDLTAVSFMDSSGLAAVLEAVQRSRESGRELTIRPGNGPVIRVLALANLLEDLPLATR